jgi:putative PIN family toxin of toxin-antitoxin system
MNKIVIDTNVFVSALMSQQGASNKLLSLVGTDRFEFSLSVPLVLEYEATAKRLIGSKIRLSEQDIDDVIDYLCSVGEHRKVYYLWRPFLKDLGDDMILELAVSAECQTIVTYNVKDFQGIQRFGIEAVTAKTFLERIGALS